MTKTIAILQSNYIPWKGYFDIINAVDEFVILDEVQYTKNDWRNRNRIKTKNGLLWLTVPVKSSGAFGNKISEMVVSNSNWSVKHWKTIHQNYAKARYFREYKDVFEEAYTSYNFSFLSQLNRHFLETICRILDIPTAISNSSSYELLEDKNDKLIHLCVQTGATEYLSGPAAKGYLDVGKFEDKGIHVHFVDYSGYPEYEQMFPPFEHGVSILDLIFNTGPHASEFMKSFHKDE